MKQRKVVPFKRRQTRANRYRKRTKRRWTKNWSLAVVVIALAILGHYFLSPAKVSEVVELNPDFIRVIDADTIAVGNSGIRLKGIAAPEKGHETFDDGRRFLGKLLRQSLNVTCYLTDERSWDRRVGRCIFEMPDGKKTDIQKAVVAAGYARGCPRFGGWRYWLDETSKSRSLPFPGYCWGLSIH